MKRLKNLDDSEICYGIYALYIKRFLDLLLSVTGLIFLSPFLLVIYILIRINLGKPVFFKQIRCGRDEKPFEMLKFRTMTDTRDSCGNLLPDTERFTKLGNFLRDYSLDELPEIVNVIKGDMSIIGPRPLYTFYVPYYSDEEALRHVVRGGITGLAQVNGRALCKWDERFSLDVKYVKNITFINDLKILCKTIYNVFNKKDIGIPSVTEEGGLHIVRDVKRPDHIIQLNEGKNIPVFVQHTKKN